MAGTGFLKYSSKFENVVFLIQILIIAVMHIYKSKYEIKILL